jgi:8-oxo-dGTP pyrophosphatase MutT (NUDIX family)
MNLFELFEGVDDHNHADALRTTGFWGSKGAGCVFLAKDTGRFLIAHRSYAVEQPNTWGGWGGAIDKGEDPVEAVKREAAEETGYNGHITIEPMYVFAKNDFRYYNFLVIVDKEFAPKLDWENQGFKWCEWGNWPSPLHFGLIALFKDSKSAELMQKLSAEYGEKRN